MSVKILKIARSIVLDSDRLTEIWDELDYYDKHKVLKDDNKYGNFNVDELDIPEIITRLLTLPSFITKASKRLKSITDKDKKEELQKLIDDKKAELEAIKALRFKK